MYAFLAHLEVVKLCMYQCTATHTTNYTCIHVGILLYKQNIVSLYLERAVLLHHYVTGF